MTPRPHVFVQVLKPSLSLALKTQEWPYRRLAFLYSWNLERQFFLIATQPTHMIVNARLMWLADIAHFKGYSDGTPTFCQVGGEIGLDSLAGLSKKGLMVLRGGKKAG